jgi:GH15 family glucan-1,4-alpha-glucosidase
MRSAATAAAGRGIDREDASMPLIEDYGLIGDTRTAALVAKNGSIDWLCLPHFDSPACFAALLGDQGHGHWQISPAGPVTEMRRSYQGDTLILETEFHTAEGVVRLVDCMPPRQHGPDVIRVVEGVRGRVPMRMELVIRFDYGSIVPWVRQVDGALHAIAGPDSVWLRTPVETRGENLRTVADFTVNEGDRVPFLLTWHASHKPAPRPLDPIRAIDETEAWWGEWASHITYQGAWRDAVIRSLLTLKALTFEPTGGIVAAPTTSLPEAIGGVRNWDYRYCWLRDATFTLDALLLAGCMDEAKAWREWLLRAVAGQPEQMQILYGVGGERRITEQELPWLPGYESSAPVRIGNAAVNQFQLDVYGEVMDALHLARRAGLQTDEADWDFQLALMDFLESNWQEPDEGLWEIRGPRRHFTHSKVMAWVAVDRAIKATKLHKLDGPVERWRALRRKLHEEVCERGYDADRNTFVQSYGSKRLDASLLMIPLVGFLPATDPRMRGTVEAISHGLCTEGLVLRYDTDHPSNVDGLPPGEGAFLACSFWLADNLALMGRHDDAREQFERLLTLRNDLGLLAEEYDPKAGRQLGNFPQAFSHVALVNTARHLSGRSGPGRRALV